MLVSMARLPTVSVITPSFNQGQFIQETIDSVLAQDYSKLEYWVIDGGSTDGTLAVLKQYGRKVHWLSEKDKGQSDAINKGLERATGEILTYINSDDVMAPGAVRQVVKAFQTHPKAMWLTGDYDVIDERGHRRESIVVLYKRVQRLLMRRPTLQRILLGINNPIVQPSTWWRRSAYEKVGKFNERLHFTMDYEYWMRLLALGSVLIIPKRLSSFRVHSSSKGGSGYSQQMVEQLSVAQRFGASPLLLLLHSLHNQLIVLTYRLLRQPKRP